MEVALQDLVIVRNPHHHQETEEAREEMTVQPHKVLIRTPMRSNIVDDPDSSGDDGGRGRRARRQTPMTINKWAKPLPKLELPPRAHLQKASKVEQLWELWSVNVALAMSTWNDVAVAYWRQVYHQSEKSYLQWRRSGMAD